MAYWRTCRRFRAEASSMAEYSSSEEEDLNATSSEPMLHRVNPDNNNDSVDQNGSISGQSEILDSCDEFGQESRCTCSSSDDNVVDDSTSENESDCTSGVSDVSPVTFRQKLATWAAKNNCHRGTVNELLGILRKEGHSLPKDSRTLLSTPRTVSTSSKCGGQYVYLGIEHGVRQILSENPSFVEKNKRIQLKVNVDGLPLFKSSSSQFWPILGCFGNQKVFVIALYYGNTKPSSVEEYLEDFLQELARLKRDGVTFESNKLSLNVHCFLCDAPARCFLKCIIGHTGYYACERCIIKGTWNGRVVFNCNEQCELRTEENFSNLAYQSHPTRPSPLIDHGISCINRFPLDYMHLVCLGVTNVCSTTLKMGQKSESCLHDIFCKYQNIWFRCMAVCPVNLQDNLVL